MHEKIHIINYVPGALGQIVALHGTYYAKYWKLGLYFEAKVAEEMGQFLGRFNEQTDGAWFAQVDDNIVGGIFIDGHQKDDDGARLRWFVIDPDYQGYGIGKQLLNTAMTFCKEKQFQRVYLTTFAGLNTARHLYEKHGFKLCGEMDGQHLTGSSDLTEQVFEYFPDNHPS